MPEQSAVVVGACSHDGAPEADWAGRSDVFARHDRCWLHDTAISSSLTICSIDLHPPRTTAEAEWARAVVQHWVADGLPLVATRQFAECGRRQLALCGPLSMTPRRIAIEVPADLIEAVARPILLADAVVAAPEAWRGALRALDRAFAAVGLTARAFGSLAWHALTGISYLHARSDVDLIVDLGGPAWRASLTPDGCLADRFMPLAGVIDEAPFACDCELRLDHDAAFSLAELRGTSTRIMVKRNDRSELVLRSALRELTV
jgi:phosphoribosyl-dephospho-CoA transferase